MSETERALGTVFLVGLGPGDAAHVTPEARSALKKADVVIGHPDSLAQVSRFTRGKETQGISQNPLERARLAVERAASGADTAIVSPGHPGIFAIASTLFSYLKENNIDIRVEVIPGLTLADYAAARLGSPLGADHAVISLGDRAGDLRDTKKRLMAAFEADFAVVIYNPRGKLGNSRLGLLLKIAAGFRTPNTPVGMITAAGGGKEAVKITTLGELSSKDVRANTLLIIGSSATYIYRGRMITPRPYEEGVGY